MSDAPKTVSPERLAEQRQAAARQERVQKLRIDATREFWKVARPNGQPQLLFTMDFNRRLDAFMRDRMNTAIERVYAWILRYSWGDNTLFVIGSDGEPMYQVDCEKQLDIKKRAISASVSYLQQRGYLEDQAKLLVPVIAPQPGRMPLPEETSRGWADFVESWKVAHSTDFAALEVARSTVARIRKVMRSEYKLSRQQAAKDAASLLETSQSTSETSGTAPVSPFEWDSLRKLNTPAKPSHEGEPAAEMPSDWNTAELRQLAAAMTDAMRRSTTGDRYPIATIETAKVLAGKVGSRKLSALKPMLDEMGDKRMLSKARGYGLMIDLISKATERHDATGFVFERIEHWQKRYPQSTFATPPVDREDPGDCALVDSILEEIGSLQNHHLVGWAMYCDAKMKGLTVEGTGLRTKSREPGTETGPKKLGLLIVWAKDYARVNSSKGAGS